MIKWKEAVMTQTSNTKSEQVTNETVSDGLEQQNSSAKAILDNGIYHALSFFNKPWRTLLPELKLCNKVMVMALAALFVGGYLPAVEFFGQSTSLYETSDLMLFKLLIIFTMFAYALGVPKLVARISSGLLVAIVGYQFYDIYREASQMMNMFGGFNVDRNVAEAVIDFLSDSTRIGFYVVVFAFIVISVMAFMPTYQRNETLWKTLTNVLKTKTEVDIDVEGFTSNAASVISSTAQKGQQSIMQAAQKGQEAIQQKDLSKLSASVPSQSMLKDKKVIGGIAGAVLLAVLMFSGGNSAPTTEEVEGIFAASIKEAMAQEIGFFNGDVKNVEVGSCKELSGTNYPTFDCDIEATLVIDTGAFGALLGGESKQEQPISDVFTFYKTDNGWQVE